MSTGDAGSTSCNLGKQLSHSQAQLVCPEGRYKLDSKDIPVVLDCGTGSSGGKRLCKAKSNTVYLCTQHHDSHLKCFGIDVPG